MATAVQKDCEEVGAQLKLPCGLALPNRLAKAAMTEGLADDYGRATPELCDLYRTWGEGGTGTLITGNVQVDRRYVERPGNVCIDGPQSGEAVQLLSAWAKAGKAAGAVMIAQLGHAGRQSNTMINTSPVGPGDVRLEMPTFNARELRFGRKEVPLNTYNS